jgi:hypothetical protein
VALPEARRPQKPIRGSGTRIVTTKREGARVAQPWQERAFAYYDMIGELHQASQFYSKPLSRLKLGVAFADPESGDLEEITSGPAVDLLEAVQDPGGGRTVMLTTYGQLMFIAGESYMLNTVDEDGVQKWEIVSTNELRFDAGTQTYTRRRLPGKVGEELKAAPDDDFEPVDEEAIVYRLWKRHPNYSGWADAPMRGVMDVAEELVMLTLAVRARARSRLAQSGILYIPNELTTQGVNVIGDEDPEADPFLDDLTTHFVTPIEDEGTAAAVVPFILRGPAKLGDVNAKDALFMLQTHELEETYPEAALRKEAIERLAIGLDMPPEALLGMTDANHWTAWQVEDAIWQTHVAPIAQQFVNDLTSIYLRPAALEMGLDRADEMVVTYDASAILTNPDRGKDALSLYKERAIGKKPLRDAMGFTDEDEPTEDELDEMLAVALRDPSLLPGFEAPPPAPVIVAPPPPVDDEPPPPVDGPPEEGDAPQNGGGEGQASARVSGAAEMALVRCRELAGSRIRSKYRARPEMRDADGVTNSDVAATLGAVVLEQMGGDPLALVEGGASAFQIVLEQWGYASREAHALGVMLEQFAARTLFEVQPPSAPAGFAGFLLRQRQPV